MAQGLPIADGFHQVIVVADHIHKRQRCTIRAGFNIIGKRNILRCLFLTAKVHQDLIFHASGGIGGKPGTFAGIKGGDAFDEPNGADGDQIFLIRCDGIVFLGGMMPVKVAWGA